MKNLRGKTVKLQDAYEVYQATGWEWRILKHYQTPDKESDNPHARVFCAVKSPMTYGTWEYGDSYLKDITGYGTLVSRREVSDA